MVQLMRIEFFSKFRMVGESGSSFFNSLPNDKILEVTKLKAFADDKLNVAKMTISLFDRVENTVGKGENACYQHFFLFPKCFPMPSSVGSLKVW